MSSNNLFSDVVTAKAAEIVREQKLVADKVELLKQSQFSADQVAHALKTFWSAEVGGCDLFQFGEMQEKQLQFMVTWLLNSSSKGLLFLGNVGSGKSTCMHVMVDFLSMIMPKKQICSCNSLELFHSFRCAQRGESTSVYIVDSGKYNEALHSKVLFLDDLGIEPELCVVYAERYSPVAELLFERFEYQKMTIISTNLTQPNIRKVYGERVYDRLATYSRLNFVNGSYRTGSL